MAYATTEELAEILNFDDEQSIEAHEEALQRVLDAAAAEIDAELGRDEPYDDDAIPALVVQVSLERAVEHWKQMKAPFGVIGVGGDEFGVGVTRAARDSWERHAYKLAPLKDTFGLA